MLRSRTLSSGTVIAVHVTLPVLGCGLVLGAIPIFKRLRTSMTLPDLKVLDLSNPTQLKVALGFGAIYAIVLVGSAWLSERAGSQGLYAVAVVSGLVDVDAITLSSLNLFAGGGVTAAVAVTAIGIAYLAAVAFKLAVVLVIGGIDLLRRVALALLAPALGIVAGLLLFA